MGKAPPRIKVAILDDGAKLADLNGVQQGWTFRLDNQEYFVGPCKHGTEMAVCVRDVCPFVELFIARLDDSHIREPNQKFTIASCTKALRWALDQGADVISMSWTYERSDGDADKAEFEEVVRNAVSKDKAIFFGSLPDRGPNKIVSRYAPVGLEGVVKISSASSSGSVTAENMLQKYDFLLPGEEIRDSKNEVARGSSFATAYAAGLAALILYSIKALEVLGDYPQSQLPSEALMVAKKAAGMKRIFEILSQGGLKDSNLGRLGHFVRPSIMLDAHNLSGSEASQEAELLSIVNNLVPIHLRRDLLPGVGPKSPG
jgi:hypothetical protein